MSKTSRWLLAVGCLLCSHLLQAATDFASLTPEQQAVLAPFEAEWGGLAESDRQRLVQATDRWLEAQPQQRADGDGGVERDHHEDEDCRDQTCRYRQEASHGAGGIAELGEPGRQVVEAPVHHLQFLLDPVGSIA